MFVVLAIAKSYASSIDEVLARLEKEVLYSYGVSRRCIYIISNRWREDPDSVIELLIEMLTNGIEIEKAWILNIENLEVIEIDLRASIPSMRKSRDPLLSVDRLEVKCMGRRCTELIKEFIALNIRISKAVIDAKGCRIELEFPRAKSLKMEIVKKLRTLQCRRIEKYREFKAVAIHSSKASIEGSMKSSECIEVLEL